MKKIDSILSSCSKIFRKMNLFIFNRHNELKIRLLTSSKKHVTMSKHQTYM